MKGEIRMSKRQIRVDMNKKCPNCGAKLSPSASICPKCGKIILGVN